jgi:hypothetical protein
MLMTIEVISLQQDHFKLAQLLFAVQISWDVLRYTADIGV